MFGLRRGSEDEEADAWYIPTKGVNKIMVPLSPSAAGYHTVHMGRSELSRRIRIQKASSLPLCWFRHCGLTRIVGMLGMLVTAPAVACTTKPPVVTLLMYDKAAPTAPLDADVPNEISRVLYSSPVRALSNYEHVHLTRLLPSFFR